MGNKKKSMSRTSGWPPPLLQFVLVLFGIESLAFLLWFYLAADSSQRDVFHGVFWFFASIAVIFANVAMVFLISKVLVCWDESESAAGNKKKSMSRTSVWPPSLLQFVLVAFGIESFAFLLWFYLAADSSQQDVFHGVFWFFALIALIFANVMVVSLISKVLGCWDESDSAVGNKEKSMPQTSVWLPPLWQFVLVALGIESFAFLLWFYLAADSSQRDVFHGVFWFFASIAVIFANVAMVFLISKVLVCWDESESAAGNKKKSMSRTSVWPPSLLQFVLVAFGIESFAFLLWFYLSADSSQFKFFASIAVILANAWVVFLILTVLGRWDESQQGCKQSVESHRESLRRRYRDSLVDQLNKPDYESRLSLFVSNNVKPSEGDGLVEAHPEYWAAETYNERTPPKSLSLIRRLLIRISNLVHGSRSRN